MQKNEETQKQEREEMIAMVKCIPSEITRERRYVKNVCYVLNMNSMKYNVNLEIRETYNKSLKHV